jgi:hypothetical protein
MLAKLWTPVASLYSAHSRLSSLLTSLLSERGNAEARKVWT